MKATGFAKLSFPVPFLVFSIFGASLHAQDPGQLRDKTLVVWAAPATLTQRGGSALTIDDRQSHFDAIVFGERAPAKWMAGSDSFRRTEGDQTSNPGETAPAATFVQLAIVYRGRQVTIYRNGKQYADYTMEAAPMNFGPQSIVMMGRRHLEASDTSSFTGAIDDARIYERPLSAEAIAALEPNQASGPDPWAWWSFENGRADDVTGRFTGSSLLGGARVVEGKLILDGHGATLIAASGDTVFEHFAQRAGGDGPVPGEMIDTVRQFHEKLLSDSYRPGYHFVTPQGICSPFDPNGCIFWKGRYHLFYIFQDARTGTRDHHWGHVSSTDLVHWRQHPTGLVGGMFSGNCFLNKEGVPTICHHQTGLGNSMVVAMDDELNAWKKLKSNPITPKTSEGDLHHGKYRSWDPFGWLEGDTYYAIFGGRGAGLVKSTSLEGPWEYVGDLLANTVAGVAINEDISCADLFEFGDKHMLLCISHRMGCRYYLGEWKDEQFHPESHAQMSWNDNGFFAPRSMLDDKGRRIMWAWIFDGRPAEQQGAAGWSGTMSLPRVLTPAADNSVLITVPEELEALRHNPITLSDLTVAAGTETPLGAIRGNSLELQLEIAPGDAGQVGLKVCRSPDGEEQTLIYYDAVTKKLVIDTTRSRVDELHSPVFIGRQPQKTEGGPFALREDEALTLRVFVDKSVVEVFANDRQAVMRRIYPTRPDSLGVTLFSKGGTATVKSVHAWDMMPTNPY